MGVIVDQKLQREVDDLEAKGQFSLAGAFRAANQVSIESLAFQANVPSRYQTLVANSVAYQAAHPVRQDAKDKKERERRGAEQAMLDAIRRQEIDRHVLKLNLGGEDVEITQGEMRRMMGARVEELRAQKHVLETTGGSVEEIRRVDQLVDAYEPTIERLADEACDEQTVEAIQELARQDPGLAKLIHQSRSVEAGIGDQKRTSYAAEAVAGGGIEAPSIMETFMRRASPAPVPATPAAPAPTPAKPQAPERAFQSLGL